MGGQRRAGEGTWAGNHLEGFSETETCTGKVWAMTGPDACKGVDLPGEEGCGPRPQPETDVTQSAGRPTGPQSLPGRLPGSDSWGTLRPIKYLLYPPLLEGERSTWSF